MVSPKREAVTGAKGDAGDLGQHVFPASFAQGRLWFLDRLEPGSAAYNVPLTLRLAGRLDIDALRLAFDSILARHEILRTLVRVENGEPVQVVYDTAHPGSRLHEADLTAMPADVAERRALDLARKEIETPFDLAHGPLIRARLLAIAAEDHILVVTVHHILADEWSLNVLTRELGTLYAAALAGVTPDLPPLEMQYADYAVWQREWLQGERLAGRLAYWKEQLRSPIPALALPTDHPRPPTQTFRGAVHRVHVRDALAGRLAEFCRAENVTLFATALAAFGVLLHRHGGQTGLLVGTPVASRSRSGLDRVVGMFLNTIVLRLDVDPKQPFRSLLAATRSTAADGFANEDVPFEKLVELCAPERDAGRSPLFQAFIVVQHTERSPASFAGLTVSQVPGLAPRTSKFDLSLFLTETEGHVEVALEYNTDLFTEATIRRMADHYCVLLAAIVAAPDTPVGLLPLMVAAEEDWVVRTLNETDAPYPAAHTLHELIEAQVDRVPDACAVEFDGMQLTYRALDVRANQLAAVLREAGVGSDVLVGVCMERSFEMVIALLAVLKAGGAYVPLDPEYPDERLEFMLADAQASVVLCQARFAGRVAGATGRVIAVDTEAPRLAARSAARVSVGAAPGDLAYVIYTSGSTGKPKGAMIPHRGIVNRLWWMQRQYDLTPHDRVLQKTPYSFDVSVWEFFWPLLAGARLVVARPDGHRDPAYLVALIRESAITTAHFVPSMLRAFLAEPGVERCIGLRRVICSGEALPADLQAQCFAQLPAELHNLYGPTEASVDVTAWACRRDDTRSSVPIGKPIANTQIYILDEYRHPVPIGVSGELYIGGVGVGRGYLGRPELTAERFVADPFRPGADARLYRTGDRARFMIGGEIEYLGRLDFQVKLRGYRIELGEIESALQSVPGVAQAVVVKREDTPGDERLVAYLVGSQRGVVPDSDALQAHLRSKLPGFMIPSAFVTLEAVPLTSSGKLDRRALPVPGAPVHAGARPHDPPETATERRLADIWREVLGPISISRADDFFSLGGHSLRATQVASRLRKAFGIALPLRVLFEARTLEELAQRVDAVARRHGAHSPARKIERIAFEGPTRLSFTQERMWLIHSLSPENSAYNIPVGLRLTGPLDVPALDGALNALRRRHETLRSTFSMIDGEPVQEVAPWCAEPLAVVDLRHLADGAWAGALRRAEADARAPFDLVHGPVLRSVLFRTADEEHLLLLTMHHIAGDQWSFGVLSREFAELYNGLRAGRPASLPPLAIRYRDYAEWQRTWLQGAEFDRQMGYWRERLANLAPLELVTDRPRPPMQTYAGASLAIPVRPALVARLEQLGRREGCTLFMTMFAAFVTLMRRYSGQDDVAVAVPIANREQLALEPLVGPFINTLVMRANAPRDLPFNELLARVREVALGAFAHQDLPFERLVEELRPPRDTGRPPLAQVLFSMQNAPGEPVTFDGVVSESVVVDRGAAQFEIGFYVDTDVNHNIVIEYNSILFDAPTMERLAAHYGVLLDAIVAAPQTPTGALELLTAGERDWTLRVLNATDAAYPADQTLTRLIEAQVERTPDACAVACDGNALTYRELNERANQLARHLRALGVAPGGLVALSLPRTFDLLVALLGVQKAGGAYLPLDPAFPAERLGFMLADSGAAVVITSGGGTLEARIPAGVRVVDLAASADALRALEKSNVEGGANADDLVYVLYTSGSTGRPKGVEVRHRSLVNLLWSMVREPGLRATDVFAAVTTISFDIAGLELYLPLMVGARVQLISREDAASGTALADRLSSSHATVLQATPATWRMLVEAGWPGATGFRAFCGGEALPRDLADALLERVGELWNLYGPTETTIWSTAERVEPGAGPILIGRPIANTRIYVVDSAGEPVPVGVPGEIWIGGAGVASGYRGRPELTSERFVRDRFRSDPAARLYRTGDLGRWTAAGRLEHLGRLDDQVKIRGFRIEVGEVESVLSAHPAIARAIVVARQAAPGDLRLIAYVAYRPGYDLTVTEVRRHLRRELPEYMIPSIVVAVDAMPLTPNGKIDRAALPDPFRGGLRSAASHVPPAPGMEQSLAEIWRDVLQVDSVGAEDNFFELGGHSLLSLRVVAAMEKRLGWRMDPRVLFFQNLRQVASTAPSDARNREVAGA